MQKFLALLLAALLGFAVSQEIPGLDQLPECGVSAAFITHGHLLTSTAILRDQHAGQPDCWKP